MADEMLNKSKPYDKSSGIQGIGDTIKAFDEYDMNVLNDPIEKYKKSNGGFVKSINKNS